jgi:hypothetical protein
MIQWALIELVRHNRRSTRKWAGVVPQSIRLFLMGEGLKDLMFSEFFIFIFSRIYKNKRHFEDLQIYTIAVIPHGGKVPNAMWYGAW